MRLTTIAASVLAIAAGFSHSDPAQAACSERQLLRLYSQGMPVSDIADRCDMDDYAVAGVVEKNQWSGAGADSFTRRQPMCCDVVGNSRCPIVAGATAIGSQCFCPGQGYGFICR